MARKRFTVEAVFRAVDKVSAPVSRMQNRVGKMTRSIGRKVDGLNRKMNKFGQKARQGALVVAAAAALTVGAMTNVIRTGAEFEQQLITAGAKFPGIVERGSDAYARLEAAARKAGRETEFTAASAAGALNFMATAGLNVEVAIASLPGAIDLATVANTDLARSTDIATDTMGAFNLESKDATTAATNLARVNDVLAKTSITSNTTLETLFETISQAGPVVSAAGGSIETMAALAGVLGSAAIKGSKAGTTIKNAYAALADPRKIGLLNKLGVRTKDAAGNTRDMLGILDDLFKVLRTMGGQEQQMAMFAIFGLRSIAGVNKLLATGADELQNYRTRLEQAGGTSKTLAAVIRDSIQNQFKELNSAVESVKISAFVRIRGALSGVIDKTTEWVRANEELISTKAAEFMLAIFTNLDKIVEVGQKVVKVTVIVGGLVIALKGLALILTIVNLLMTTGPVGWLIAIVGVVAALGFLLGRWITNNETLMNAAWQVSEAVKGAWKSTIDWLNTAWDNTIGKLKDGLAWVKRAFGHVQNGANVVGDFLGLDDGFLGFGGGGDDDGAGAGAGPQPQVVSPGDRVARSVEENNTTTRGELTIRDESARMSISGGVLPPGVTLVPSGGF